MAVDKSMIGAPTGNVKVVMERGPLTNFATAVKDENPIYHDAKAAEAAGFDNIPAPPTWGFAMRNWGLFKEVQPEGGTPKQNPMMKILGGLMQQGGMILHGEQEFEYHRPIVAGDVLVGEGKIADIYEKESKGRTMTFVVTEDVFRDEKTGDAVLTMRSNILHRG